MSALQPTPETDAQCYDCEYRGEMGGKFTADAGTLRPDGDHVPADFARRLERERDSAKTLNRTLLDQLEAQAVQSKAVNEELTEARLHHRKLCLALLSALGVKDAWAITTWTQRQYVEAIEAMRKAIKEAIPALQACSENIGSRYGKLSDDADAALAKLKPLLP